jgi:hypothetical protein
LKKVVRLDKKPRTKKKQNPNKVRNKRRIENIINIFGIFSKSTGKKGTIFT